MHAINQVAGVSVSAVQFEPHLSEIFLFCYGHLLKRFGVCELVEPKQTEKKSPINPGSILAWFAARSSDHCNFPVQSMKTMQEGAMTKSSTMGNQRKG